MKRLRVSAAVALTMAVILTQVGSFREEFPVTFEELLSSFVQQNKTFVDKSLLIKEVLDDEHKVIVITAPSRWGKSINMDMLRRFFALELDVNGNRSNVSHAKCKTLIADGEMTYIGEKEETKLFTSLKISKYDDAMGHLGKYPIVKISLRRKKLVDAAGYVPSVLHMIRDELAREFSERKSYLARYVLGNESLMLKFGKYCGLSAFFELNREEVVDGLRFLSELLYKHCQEKVFILVDDFEQPFMVNLTVKWDEVEEIMELFGDLYARTFVNNAYLQKAILTGVLMLEDVRNKVFSRLGDQTLMQGSVYDERFSQFYGFGLREMNELLDKVPGKRRILAKLKIRCGGVGYQGMVFNPSCVYVDLSLGKLYHNMERFRIRSSSRSGKYEEDMSWERTCPGYQLDGTVQRYLQKLYLGGGVIQSMESITCRELCSPSNALKALYFCGLFNGAADVEGNVLLNIPNDEAKLRIYLQIEKFVRATFEVNSTFLQMPIPPWPELTGHLFSGYSTNFKKSWRDIIVKKGTNILQYNSMMIALFGSMEWSHDPHMVKFSEVNGTGALAVAVIPISKDPLDLAMVIEYELAADEDDLDAVAVRCVQQIDSGVFDDAIKKAGVKTIRKMCMVFGKTDVAVRFADKMMQKNEKFKKSKKTTESTVISISSDAQTIYTTLSSESSVRSTS